MTKYTLAFLAALVAPSIAFAGIGSIDGEIKTGAAVVEEATDSAPSTVKVITPEPSEGFFIWNGSEHSWSYNHRLNRMGSGAYMYDADGGAPGDSEQTLKGVVHAGEACAAIETPEPLFPGTSKNW